MPPCSADDRAVSPPPQLSDVFNLADANGDGGVSFEVQRCRYNFRSTPRSLTSLYDTLQEFCVVSSMPEESHMDLARCAIAEFIGVALFQVRSSTCSCRC